MIVNFRLRGRRTPAGPKKAGGHFSAGFTLDAYGHRLPSRELARNLPTNAREESVLS